MKRIQNTFSLGGDTGPMAPEHAGPLRMRPFGPALHLLGNCDWRLSRSAIDFDILQTYLSLIVAAVDNAARGAFLVVDCGTIKRLDR